MRIHLSSLRSSPMPKIRTQRTKQPPEGFEAIEQILEGKLDSVFAESVLISINPDYTRKMRDVEAELVDGKRKNETLWPVMRISHTRSRCRCPNWRDSSGLHCQIFTISTTSVSRYRRCIMLKTILPF